MYMDIRVVRDVRDVIDVRGVRDVMDVRGVRDVRDIRDVRDVMDVRDVRDVRDVMDVMDVRDGMDFASFYDISFGFLNYFNSVIFFLFFPVLVAQYTHYYNSTRLMVFSGYSGFLHQ